MSEHSHGRFKRLFSEIEIGGQTIRNRIVSTGHHTYLSDGAPDENLVAYHKARAQGGAGLIIVEIAGIHKTATFSDGLLMLTSRDSIPGYRSLVKACRSHGARVFAQLFHPGREIRKTRDGFEAIAYAPSEVPNDRFHIMPRSMSSAMIQEIVEGHATGAEYLVEAGVDGIEIVASHGYLLSQFLNPSTNLRDDDYGGSYDARLKFVREIVAGISSRIGDLALGIRISGNEFDSTGLHPDLVVQICHSLSDDGLLDYFNITAGTSASLGGSVHIVPPMGLKSCYTSSYGAAAKAATGKPVIVTGRINQPQDAERIIAEGHADLCGMTRAMICDPEMPNKARQGRLDDIRACIACNQACIGRAQKSLGISCIQHPETGREIRFGQRPALRSKKEVMVVGGGPAGMKAAAVAAERGHRVILYEVARHLGGQARLACRLPGREEFGGIITNLEREMALANVEVRTGTIVDKALVMAEHPDAVVLATGAQPYLPRIEGADEAQVVTAWDVIEGRVNVGASVVIADWKCDWIGIGIAEMLAAQGCRVRLCVNGGEPGESIQLYTRNYYQGRLYKLGVEIHPHVRVFGADADTAYFQNTVTNEPVLFEGMDTLVLSLGHRSIRDLEEDLQGLVVDLHAIGDCVAPRTAEEAVYEGLEIGCLL